MIYNAYWGKHGRNNILHSYLRESEKEKEKERERTVYLYFYQVSHNNGIHGWFGGVSTQCEL